MCSIRFELGCLLIIGSGLGVTIAFSKEVAPPEVCSGDIALQCNCFVVVAQRLLEVSQEMPGRGACQEG